MGSLCSSDPCPLLPTEFPFANPKAQVQEDPVTGHSELIVQTRERNPGPKLFLTLKLKPMVYFLST